MKAQVVSLLIGIVPLPVIGVDTIRVEVATFVGKSRRPLVHDLEKLSRRKEVHCVNARSATTHAGKEAHITLTRDFYVRSLAPTKHPIIPTGFDLHVIPYVTSEGIAYRANLKIREYESISPPKTDPVATFVTRELYASGVCKSGEAVWIDFPVRDGQATSVRMLFVSKQ